MALAFNTAWGNLIHTFIKGRRDFLGHLNQMIEVPEAAQAGAVTATLLTNMTATAITDGTMVTNLANQVQVPLTMVDYQANLSLQPKYAKSSLTKPENLAMIAEAAGDAFATAAQLAVIAACAAATAGLTDTLTVGQVDFVTDATAGEALDNLRTMAAIIAQCFAYHADLRPDEFCIAMPPAGWANFISLQATGCPNPILNATTGMYSFMGVPLYPFDATNFGGASNPVAYVLNRRNYAMKFVELGLHGGGPIAASDATTKWISTCSFVHGVILDDYIGEILNPAS